MTQGRIPTLDGLRAVAILLVLASHTMAAAAVGRLGHVGVLIFFALSGYLITSRLLDEYRKTGAISLRDFYLRRAFRILPPAIVFLAVMGILASLGFIVCTSAALRAALLFYINYNFVSDFGGPGWRVGHFWSLSVEEHFYLFWPCLLIGFGIARGWRQAGLLALAICVWRPIDDHFHLFATVFGNPRYTGDFYRTDMIADALLWGCCLAFALRKPIEVSRGKLLSAIAAGAVGGSLLLICVMDIEHVTPLLNILPALLVAAIVAVPTAPIGRFLDLQPMRYIGKLSYIIYIWQQLFIGGPGGLDWPVPLSFAAMFACAYLSYRFIELPCINFGRQIITSRHLVPEPA